MKITFWGVRGGIPVPGPSTVKYGGNTSCVSVEVGDELIILDAGTGIRMLGLDILARKKNIKAHLFLSHVHWDHIQGFPFFNPAYIKGNIVHIYGAEKADTGLSSILAGQMEGPNFPVSIDQMGGQIFFHDIQEGETIPIESDKGTVATVFNKKLNHPNGVLGYRIKSKINGKSFVFATDTEHYNEGIDKNLLELCREAETIIYDSQYTTDEYYGNNGNMPHEGWGHSTWEKGLEIVLAAGLKNFLLFHHDQSHDDKFLDDLYSKIVKHLENQGKKDQIKVIVCQEGFSLEI